MAIEPSPSLGPTLRYGPVPRYPESDRKPLGESGVRLNVIFAVLDMLRRHYAGEHRVAVLSNMFVYYVEGDPKKVVCPDVFVTLNVPPNTTRRTFKTWLEGKGPDLVIEVTSKKTKKEDLGKKLEIYRDVLKVREYFLFDPLQEYLEPSLQGFRLVQSRYETIRLDEVGLFSEILGLRLERDELDLRLFDPAKGRRIPTAEELVRELRKAEEDLRELRRANETLLQRLREDKE